MKYQDNKKRYTIELRDNWIKQKGLLWYLISGKSAVFKSKDREAYLVIDASENGLKQFEERYFRAMIIGNFLRTPNSFAGTVNYIKEVDDFELDGEKNTVYYRYAGTNGFGRIISSVHNDIEYKLQSIDLKNSHEASIDAIIESFRFNK